MSLLHVAVGKVGGELEVAADVVRIRAKRPPLCLQ